MGNNKFGFVMVSNNYRNNRRKLMKSFLVFLLMSFSMFAQTSYLQYFQNSYDSTTAAKYDTLKVWDFNKSFSSVFVTVENLSGSVACTLSVSGATFIRNVDSWNQNSWQSPITDTTFSKINIRDDTWTTVSSLIVPASTSITYWLAKEKLEGLRAYLTNTAGGNCRVIVEGNP